MPASLYETVEGIVKMGLSPVDTWNSISALSGSVAGSAFGGAIGTYAPTVLKPVLGPSAGMVSDIFGTMGGEVISNELKNTINGVGDKNGK